MKSKLKGLIRDDKLEEAFSLIEDQMPESITGGTDFILIKNSYSDLKKKEQEFRITESDKRPIKSQILRDFLDFIENIFENINKGSKIGDSKKNINSLFQDKLIRRFSGVKLADLYVEPFFSVSKKNYYVFNRKDEGEGSNNFSLPHKPLSIHGYIKEFFLKGKCISSFNEHPPDLLLILGYPGQGKTALCYKVINDVASREDPALDLEVWYLSLAEVLPSDVDQLINNPFVFSESKSYKLNNVNFEKILLILDGLNEIDNENQSGLSQNDIQILTNKLSSEVKKQSFFKIILTCRLNFFDTTILRKNDILTVRLEPFDLNQQLGLLNRVSFLDEKNSCKEELIKISNKGKGNFSFFEKIIGIPAILELFIEIHPRFIDGGNKKSYIYQFLEEITTRSWGVRGQFDRLYYLKPSILVEVSKTIAKLVKKSNNNSITITDLVKEEELVKFLREQTTCEVDHILKDILTSFFFEGVYFGQEGNKGLPEKEYIFSFINDALQEWFYAEYVFGNLNNNLPDFSGSEAGDNYSNKNALKLIWESFVEVPVSEEIFKNMLGLVEANLFKSETRNQFKNRLIEHFPRFIKYDLLYEYHSNYHFPPPCPIEMCLNGFYYFWHFLKSICSQEKIIALEESLIEKKHKTENEEEIRLSAAEEDKIAVLPNFGKLLRIEKITNNRAFNLSWQDLSGENFQRILFQGDDFSYARLIKVDLSNSILQDCILNSVNLNGAFLNKVKFLRVEINDSSLTSVSMSEALLMEVQLKNSNFEAAIMENVTFSQVQLTNASFKAADLKGSDLSGADVRGSNFEFANLFHCILNYLDLSGINFYSAHLEKAEIKGAILHNTNFELADLTGANLASCEIDSNTSFRNAVLEETVVVDIQGLSNLELAEKLSEAKSLNGIILQKMRFQEVKSFQGFELIGANFSYCNLSKADFSYCNLSGAVFSYCNLSGANFGEAILDDAIFKNVSFDNEINLGNASLKNINLVEIEGIGSLEIKEILLKAKTLLGINGLSMEIIQELEEEYPTLFSTLLEEEF